MEVAASGIAVASIAIQLIESISKINTFLNSVKEAPNEIASLLEDLALLRGILENIRQRDEQTRRGSSSTMDLALARCTRLMNELARLVPTDQKSSSSFRRKRASFKFVRKSDKIQQLKAKIEGTKVDLLLAHCDLESRMSQNHQEQVQNSISVVQQSISIVQTCQLDTNREVRVLSHQVSSRQQQKLLDDPAQASLLSDQTTEIASSSAQVGFVELTGTKSLDVPQTQPLKSPSRVSPETGSYRKAKRYSRSFKQTYTTVTQTPFGKLVCMTTRHGTCCDTWVYHDCDAEVETTYTFVPFWWVVKFGMMAFELDLPQFSTQGWQTKIRAWNVRPRNSSIFKACEGGDVEEVKRMLTEGEASINDTTEYGWTLLHIAANSLQPEICRLLMERGVDKFVHCLTFLKSTAFALAYKPLQQIDWSSATFSFDIGAVAPYRETMRLFLRCEDRILGNNDQILNRNAAGLGLWISTTGEENLRWFLNSVLRVVYPTADNEQLWSNLLYYLLEQDSYDNQLTGMEVFVSEILRRCSLESARTVLWRLFDPQELGFAQTIYPLSRPVLTRPRIFRLLVDKTGGVELLHTPTPHRERQHSFLSFVLQSSQQWRLFEQAINQSSFEVLEVIRGDLDLYQFGWTEDGLAAMFDQQDIAWLKPEHKTAIHLCGLHDLHSYFNWNSRAPDTLDQLWGTRKKRCMEGVALDTPSGEELALLASWKELSNTQHPTSCMVCNWLAVQSSLSAGESRRRAARGIAEEENSPFLLAI